MHIIKKNKKCPHNVIHERWDSMKIKLYKILCGKKSELKYKKIIVH